MLDQKRLKEMLNYDPDTGIFTWRIRAAKKTHIGDQAGSIFKHRNTHYRQIMLDGSHYKAHRLAWLYMHGKWPEGQIDHKDGNGLHNWAKNLRDVNNCENQRNCRISSNNTSGVIGVSFHKKSGTWSANIGVNSKQKGLGYFIKMEDAIEARKRAEIEFGYHKNHGRKR